MYRHNFHTHTEFCDGIGKPADFVAQAIQMKMNSLGFSAHAPVDFKNNFAISRENLTSYQQSIRQLQQLHQHEISLYLALEADYIPGRAEEFLTHEVRQHWDYCIGSVHLVKVPENDSLWFIDGKHTEVYDRGLQEYFSGDAEWAVTTYYHQIQEMLKLFAPDIVGHLDKIKMHNRGRFFQESTSWYRRLIGETLQTIQQSQVIVEINTRGLYKKRCQETFPSTEILEEILHLNIPVTLNADAHQPDELMGAYEEVLPLLKGIGFQSLKIRKDGVWQDEEI